MEETPSAEQESQCCASCGNPAYLKEYPTKLCSECRDKFIRFPIPKWLWLFAGAIGVIIVFSLYTLPKNISTGVALERGIKAEKQHRWLTAQRAFETVVKKEPSYIEGNGHLLIAAFYNFDFVTFSQEYQKLVEKKVENTEFFSRLSDVAAKAVNYYPGDSMRALQLYYDSLHKPMSDSLLAPYAARHPEDIYAGSILTTIWFYKKQYTATDSLLNKILGVDPDFCGALRVMAALRRETNDLPASLSYCDRMLNLNREDIYAMGSKARTLLKMKQDKDAMKLLQQALDLDPKDSYAIATLVLAYHVTGDTKKRDELMNRYRNDSSVQSDMGYVNDIINKKEFFRN